jgi:hypothetical protein
VKLNLLIIGNFGYYLGEESEFKFYMESWADEVLGQLNERCQLFNKQFFDTTPVSYSVFYTYGNTGLVDSPLTNPDPEALIGSLAVVLDFNQKAGFTNEEVLEEMSKAFSEEVNFFFGNRKTKEAFVAVSELDDEQKPKQSICFEISKRSEYS